MREKYLININNFSLDKNNKYSINVLFGKLLNWIFVIWDFSILN